jgi:hypothetical protein
MGTGRRPISRRHRTTNKEAQMHSTSLGTASSAARRLRVASPALHGGASSVLRLARGSDARLPSGAALNDWAERAAAMLDLTPMMVGPLTQPHTVAEALPASVARELRA